MKIYFVGIHNKPDMEPLDSISKTGRLVDRCIAALQIELNLFEADFCKTNLFNANEMPVLKQAGSDAKLWAERVGWKEGDIVISLGAIVHTFFRRSGIKFIAVGHPSGVWSNKAKEDYIVNVLIKVNEQINPVLTH